VVAARSIPPVLGRLLHVTAGSGASVSLGCGRAGGCGPGVDDGNVADPLLPRVCGCVCVQRVLLLWAVGVNADRRQELQTIY
jgi:hypothetical protein